MKNITSTLKIKDQAKILFIAIILILFLILFPNINKLYVKESKLYVSEIMVRNTYTLLDNDDEYSDYIELYNGYDHDINLLGYHLADTEFDANKWTFPDISIKAHEYLIIYASGKDKCDLEKRICHTSFKLSSKGEKITLTDNGGNIINKFTYPMLVNDISYGFTNKYEILDTPTPGKKNSKGLNYSKITNKELYINEYMTHNKKINYDSDGNYYDFIELYNNSNKDLILHNIFLSDDKDNLMKYKLPDITLKKESYLLINMGDESKYNDNQITSSFKLSDNDKDLILSNGDDIIDSLKLKVLIDNISYGRVDDKWYYFTKPTPGSINNTKAYLDIGDIK